MRSHHRRYLLEQIGDAAQRRLWQFIGLGMLTSAGALAISLATWSARDPSLNHATGGHVRNLLGGPGGWGFRR